MHVVQKPFQGPDGVYERNELIDASKFRNVTLLLDQRYIRLATPDEINAAEEVEPEEVEEEEVVEEEKGDKKKASPSPAPRPPSTPKTPPPSKPSSAPPVKKAKASARGRKKGGTR